MIAPYFNPLCKQAEQYYYKFFFGASQESIPESIVNHINQCQHCNEKIGQLKSVLSQDNDYISLEQDSRATAALLKLHFAYIGKRVTCETAKPFLLGQIDAALEIKIPTPITVHLDNCQQCLEDLEIIRKLNLNRKQLCRLSQLFAEKHSNDNVSCSQAQDAVLAVISMAFNETNKEVLKHLCVCPDCRKLLYQRMETVCNEYLDSKIERKNFPCEKISTTDLFDYVIPYGLDPATDEYVKFRQFLISHIHSCPVCLAKMQQLHKTVFSIAERPESGIVTIYRIDKSAKAQATNKSNGIYADFPIRVEVASGEDKVKAGQPASTINTTAKKKVSSINIKPVLRIGAAAAAIVLISTTLFLNIPTAKAVSLERIYKAIEKVKNVHISSFVPGKKEPVQQQWVSRTLNVNIIKTEKESVLWDIPNSVRKVKHLSNNSVEITKLSAEIITATEETIGSFWGLVPFADISVIPVDAEWSCVTNGDLEVIPQDIEIYDLIWTEKIYEGHPVFRKWRFFVNPKTNLPVKTEFYQKLSDDNEYILESLNTAEYMDDSKMRQFIKEILF